MTGKMSFEAVEVLVHDPVVVNREATRGALNALGFHKIEAVGSLELLEKQLSGRTPDLIFCEVTGVEAELCKAIQTLRQGLSGNNPYALVVATTWRRDDTLVKLFINCGADDLLARPFSPELLGERLRAHIERRKGFVVTTEYIGPDRRRDFRSTGKDEKADNSGGMIEVPNSLRMKVVDGLSGELAERAIAKAINAANHIVNQHKMRRDAFQLCLQWRLIEQRNPSARDFSDMLARMAALAAEVKRRAGGEPQDPTVKWCNSIIDCVETIGPMLNIPTTATPSIPPGWNRRCICWAMPRSRSATC